MNSSQVSAIPTPNPMDALPPAPPVSKKTMHMAGLLVDVYGLGELLPSAGLVSALWLHHPRLGAKEAMADTAARCVDAWNASAWRTAGAGRGLIALAFDQRNHGSRTVDAVANGSWRDGNPTHAQDMFGIIAGTVADQMLLLDVVGTYLFAGEGEGEGEGDEKRSIDQHLALGVSLGGHSVVQLLFRDARVVAGVSIIGCPDYQRLLQDRARQSNLSTYTDGEASFLGSKDFPPALVEHCKSADPKAMIFGTRDLDLLRSSPDSWNQDEAKAELLKRLKGKRFFGCFGGDDKLVPYRCSEPFMTWLKSVAQEQSGTFYVEDKIYPGVGHSLSAQMVSDALRFVLDTVALAGAGSKL